jgi:hypothetical protein
MDADYCRRQAEHYAACARQMTDAVERCCHKRNVEHGCYDPEFISIKHLKNESRQPVQQQTTGHAAGHAFTFDNSLLDRCGAAVLALPGGKSAHLELGYMIGSGKKGFVPFDKEPERWDACLNLHMVSFLY